MHVSFTGHDKCDLEVNLRLQYEVSPTIPCPSEAHPPVCINGIKKLPSMEQRQALTELQRT